MSLPRADRVLIVLMALVALAGLVGFTMVRADRLEAAQEGVFEGPVARADCGPGSSPETALQGQVPKAERDSGRSRQGYRCNLELLGRYQGEGSSWVSQSYRNCAYMSTRFPSGARSPGVQVVDVSDPRAPKLATTLTSPAMRGTWETLKVNEARGLLAAVSAPSPGGNGLAFFDVYDIKEDCSRPRLLNSVPVPQLTLPANVGGHEGNWAPDGDTYWATFLYSGGITAIDVTDPAQPRPIFTGQTSPRNHGLSVSADGNRLYIADIADRQGARNGLQIFDVSDVQARRPAPQIREVGSVYWSDGSTGQHAVPFTSGGRSYVVFVDELDEGAARIIDITDETSPRIVSKLKLEIHLPEHAGARAEDTENTGIFGYDGHYCDIDRQTDPTAVACGYFQSGVRVFDIRDVGRPKEIAYYNPPAQLGRNAELQSSEHATNPIVGTGSPALNTDWCSSPPRFVGDQLWVTCQDNGFMALRFTNRAFPLGQPQRGAPRLLGPRRCASRRRFTIRVREPRGVRLRSARVYVAGRRVKVRRSHGRLRARVNLRGRPKGTFRVRVVAKTRSGRTIRGSRRYRTCIPTRKRR